MAEPPKIKDLSLDAHNHPSGDPTPSEEDIGRDGAHVSIMASLASADPENVV